MNRVELMGELRTLLEHPSGENFEEAFTFILKSDVSKEELKQEVLPYVEEHVKKYWPTHVPRHVPSDMKEEAIALREELPLYRLPPPVDLTLLDDKAMKLLPYDYGDGGLGQIAELRSYLEEQFQLEPVKVELGEDNFQDFFPWMNTSQEGKTLFHHGDLHLKHGTRTEGEHMLTVTGDLVFDEAITLCENFGIGVGGDLIAPAVTIDVMMMVEGAIQTKFANIEPYESDMDGNILAADFAVWYLGRFEDTSPCRLCLELGASTMDDSHVEQLRQALKPEIFEQMESTAQEQDAGRGYIQSKRLAWIRTTLRDMLLEGVDIWKAS